MMSRTQNNANNSYYFGTNVNNNNKSDSNLAIPFFDYYGDDESVGFWVRPIIVLIYTKTAYNNR